MKSMVACHTFFNSFYNMGSCISLSNKKFLQFEKKLKLVGNFYVYSEKNYFTNLGKKIKKIKAYIIGRNFL